MRLSPCVLVQPDGWARGEREGYGEPCDVTSLSLDAIDAATTTRPRVKTTQLRYTAVAVTMYIGSRAPRPFAEMSYAAGAP